MSLISAAVVSAMAAQNIGAGRWDRIGRITGYGMGYLLLITGMMVAVILLFHAPLLALFLGRNEAAIAAAWHMQLLASWRSEEHTSELQSLMRISYAVFCLK